MTSEELLSGARPAAVPATYQIEVRGVWRDALLVHEIALRLFGSTGEAKCQTVREFIHSGALFAHSTGRSYLIPVGAYVAWLRGQSYRSGD